MSRGEIAALVVTTALLSAGAGASLLTPRRMDFGVIRPPPSCDVGLFEVCDKPQGDEQCHWEKRFSCEAAQPAFRRIYRDPFKED